MKSHLFLMQAQGEIQRVGVTVLQAARHYALKHSADLLLHSFDADSHVHVGNCHNSCRVKNCGGSDIMVTAAVQGSCREPVAQRAYMIFLSEFRWQKPRIVRRQQQHLRCPVDPILQWLLQNYVAIVRREGGVNKGIP